jgi:hypothetical protein
MVVTMTNRAWIYHQHARLVELGMAQPCGTTPALEHKEKNKESKEPKQQPKEGEWTLF